MESGAQQLPAPAHDVFISYSRKDRDFARALEQALESYRPPRDLPVPQRSLDVFRDEDDFTGVDYDESIGRHLKDSAHLVVLCSPHARKSPYVDEEIRRFAATNGAAHIIPVLVAGIPNNEAQAGQDGEQAFPDALSAVMGMPLGADYRGFDLHRDKVNRGVFYGPWYTVLANLYSVPRSEIEERDKKRLAHARRVKNGIIGGIIAALSTALAVALFYWHQAVVQRNIAVARRLVAETEVVRDYEVGALLALEALQRLEIPESDAAVRTFHRTLFYRRNNPDDDEDDDRVRKVVHLGTVIREVGDEVTVSADGRLIATTDADRLKQEAVVYETGTGAEVERLKNPIGVSAVAISGDARSVAIGGYDNVARVIARAGRKEVSHLTHGDFVVDVAFAPDGRYVATASFDKTARVFETATGKEMARLTHDGHVLSVAFSADGRRVATGCEDKNARVFEAASGTEIARRAFSVPVEAVAFSPDGRWVIAGGGHSSKDLGGSDGGVFEAATGKEVSRLEQRGWFRAASFSPDGRRVATAGDAAHVFDPATGALVARLNLPGRVLAVAFVEDGRSLLTISTIGLTASEGIVTRHRLRRQDLAQDVCSLLTRNLAENEWAQYVGAEVPYHKTCPNF